MKNITFSITTSINRALKAQTLTFEGDLGIKNAGEILKIIQGIKFTVESVTIQLKNIEKLDITSIQTIRALCIALNSQGKKTEIVSGISENFERLLINTGFSNIL